MVNTLLKVMGGGKLLADYNRYKTLRNCGFLKLFIVYPEFRYQFLYRLMEVFSLSMVFQRLFHVAILDEIVGLISK